MCTKFHMVSVESEEDSVSKPTWVWEFLFADFSVNMMQVMKEKAKT